MALKNFIKENFVLVVGLTLPVLLVALFFVASVLPKSAAIPPQYEMLFTVIRYDYQNPPPYNVDFIVKDGALKARVSKNVKPPPNTYPPQNFNWKRLMVYDGKTQNVREIAYDLSKIGDVADSTEMVFDEVKNLKVDNAVKSPDGYEFNSGGYRSGGFPAEIFWGGSYRSSNRVTKGAVSFKIPENANSDYGYSLQFVGWVTGKE